MVGRNLLIIHPGALGDFVLTFPSLIRLRKYFSGIDVLCQSGLGKLAKSLGLVQNGFALEASHVATLFSAAPDSEIRDFLSSYAEILLFSISAELEETIRRITSKPVCRMASKPAPQVRRHVAEFILENLVRCGLITKTDAVLTDIPLPRWDDRPGQCEKIVLHPGAGSIRKQWPLSNFCAVEAILEAHGMKPEFLLGPAEHNLKDMFPDKQRSVHSLTDFTELTDLLGSAGGYIGNDSGVSHLAAFLGVPSVVIFGPSDPNRWKPVGSTVEIVRPGLECHPCFETGTDNCEDPACLLTTTPSQVIQAFYRVCSVSGQD